MHIKKLSGCVRHRANINDRLEREVGVLWGQGERETNIVSF